MKRYSVSEYEFNTDIEVISNFIYRFYDPKYRYSTDFLLADEAVILLKAYFRARRGRYIEILMSKQSDWFSRMFYSYQHYQQC